MSEFTDYTPCLFCGGDISAPDHDAHCDGKQGGRDDDDHDDEQQHDDPPPPEPPPTVRIKKKRDTSAQAFYNAVDSGKFQTKRQEIYIALRDLGRDLGPQTANEVHERLIKSDYRWRKATTNNTRARLTELRDFGVVREMGERLCTVTLENCIIWEVIPAHEYVGPANIVRCPHCKQTMYRDQPFKK